MKTILKAVLTLTVFLLGGGVNGHHLHYLENRLRTTKGLIELQLQEIKAYNKINANNSLEYQITEELDRRTLQEQLDSLNATKKSLERAIDTSDHSNNALDIALSAHERSTPGSKEEDKTKKSLSKVISSSKFIVKQIIGLQKSMLARKAKIYRLSMEDVNSNLKELGFLNCQKLDDSLRKSDRSCDLGTAKNSEHCTSGKCKMSWDEALLVIKKEIDLTRKENHKDELALAIRKADIVKLLGRQNVGSTHQAYNLLTSLENKGRHGNISFQKSLGENFIDLIMMGVDDLEQVAEENNMNLAQLQKDLNSELKQSFLGHHVQKETMQNVFDIFCEDQKLRENPCSGSNARRAIYHGSSGYSYYNKEKGFFMGKPENGSIPR